jgi:hypothetical protein
MNIPETLSEILCQLAIIRDMVETPTLDLPGENDSLDFTLGAAGVEVIKEFVIESNQPWASAFSAAHTMRLIGVDGSTIATIPMGSIPSYRTFTNPDKIKEIGLTSTVANARFSLWRPRT